MDTAPLLIAALALSAVAAAAEENSPQLPTVRRRLASHKHAVSVLLSHLDAAARQGLLTPQQRELVARVRAEYEDGGNG